MKKAGEVLWDLRSYHACEHQGRVFNFTPDDQGKFWVSELILTEEVEVKEVNTRVDCKCNEEYLSSCCSCGSKILVTAGKENATDFFCALVSIDPGELTRDPIHIEEKKVIGWEKYKSAPFLAQISENKMWASFHNSNEIWIGELKGDELVMTKHLDHLPMEYGFGAVPLPLPDGRLLVAGGWPSSTDITLITPGEHFSFEKIGDMPRTGGYGVSTILVKEKFVVGFGGWNHNNVADMWIFDTRTHRGSTVKRKRKWHPGGPWLVLVVRDKDLYVIGGLLTSSAHCISFATLSRLIERGRIRSAFCSCLGFPFQPGKRFKRHTLSHCIPVCL